MTFLPRLSLLLALAGCSLAFVPRAHAESFHTCAGFIDAVPVTITRQGVWCLRKDLSTGITIGSAIAVNTNNVTIDCNGFKLGGLLAGASSSTIGIAAFGRANITVRNCSIRGFRFGIRLDDFGSGHLVEDNRLDNNLQYGIYVDDDNSLVQRNRVFDTGGATGQNLSYGLFGKADFVENTVGNVFAAGTNAQAIGITVRGAGTEVRGNRIRGLIPSGTGIAIGIDVFAPGVTIVGNRITNSAQTPGTGIFGLVGPSAFCGGNTIARFQTAISGCLDIGGNGTL